MATADELGALFDEIGAGVRARKLVVYAGTPIFPTRSLDAEGGDEEASAYPVAAWSGDWPAFLDLAGEVGATIVYLDGLVFSLDEYVRETARILEHEAGDGMDAALVSVVGSRQWLHQRLQERAEPWRPRDGQHFIVECVWRRDGIAHRFTRVADWYEKFVAEIATVPGDVEHVAREDRQLRTTEEALRLQRLADEMADLLVGR